MDVSPVEQFHNAQRIGADETHVDDLMDIRVNVGL